MNPGLPLDAELVIRFIEGVLVHTKGRWKGQSFLLEPWQRAFIRELFRTENGRRVYREALLWIARKNGKSALVSALCLTALVLEGTLTEAGAEVYAAASSKAQARIVFGEAKKMVEASPLLSDWCRVYRDVIAVPSTGAIFRVLAADALKVHGLNPTFVAADELHAWEDDELWHALATGGLARENPLIAGISTAGFDYSGIAGKLHERGVKGTPITVPDLGADVRNADGLLHVDFFVPGDERDSPEHWKKANPSSWITSEALVRESKRHPLSVFIRLHLNGWVSAETRWLPSGAWDRAQGEVQIEEGDEVFVGVDLGTVHDATAVVEVCPKDGVHHVRCRIFVPPEGGKLDIALVENHIRDIALRQSVREVVFDPWRFARSAELLEDEGLTMVEFPMSAERMVPASQGLFDAITQERIVHDGDPELKAHIEAATAKDTGRGWRLWKQKSKAPMDACIALATAVARAEANDEGGFSVRFMDEPEPISAA